MIRIHRLMVLVIAGVIAVLACALLGAEGSEPPSYVLASAPLSAADHEADEGFFSASTVSLSVPPRSTAADVLRQLRGQDVEIVIRVKAKRELQQVVR